jgi:hypothetical protein
MFKREEIGMRAIAASLFGLIGGVVAGLMLSEIIGIVGYLMFDSAVGIKLLPIYLAILFAVVAPAVDARFRRRSEQPLYRRNQRSRP